MTWTFGKDKLKLVNAKRETKSKERKKERKTERMGCRRSSVDLSAPTILPPRAQVPSTPSMLLSL